MANEERKHVATLGVLVETFRDSLHRGKQPTFSAGDLKHFINAMVELRTLLDAPDVQSGKLPPVGRQAVWQAIDEALTGTLAPILRGEICNILAARLVPHSEPVKVAFDTLSYGAKYKYAPEHGPDKVYVKIGHNLVAAWDERLVASSWRAQGLFSFAGEDSALSDAVYLVRDSDLNATQAQGEVIEQQRKLIASLRAELVESYSIGAHAPLVAPKSECPACLGDRALRCDACIPDFTPGSGNSARRRIQAIEKGCPQPQAHPARCGCKDGNE